jgi:hypothetical protein
MSLAIASLTRLEIDGDSMSFSELLSLNRGVLAETGDAADAGSVMCRGVGLPGEFDPPDKTDLSVNKSDNNRLVFSVSKPLVIDKTARAVVILTVSIHGEQKQETPDSRAQK